NARRRQKSNQVHGSWYYRNTHAVTPAVWRGGSMYGDRLAGFGACYNMPSVAQPQAGAAPQIRCVEVADVRIARSDGRLTVQGFRIAGNMARDKEQKFRKRFVERMHKNSLGQKLLQTVNAGPFPVSIAWGNDNFGFNGTIAMDRDRALD